MGAKWCYLAKLQFSLKKKYIPPICQIPCRCQEDTWNERSFHGPACAQPLPLLARLLNRKPLMFFFFLIQTLYYLLIYKKVHSELLSPSQEGILGVSSCTNTHSSVKRYWGLMICATHAFLILFKKCHKHKYKELWWATHLQGTQWPSMTKMRCSCIMASQQPPWEESISKMQMGESLLLSFHIKDSGSRPLEKKITVALFLYVGTNHLWQI